MATTLYWLFAAVASLMTIGTLLTGLFVWGMWARPAEPRESTAVRRVVNRSVHPQ